MGKKLSVSCKTAYLLLFLMFLLNGCMSTEKSLDESGTDQVDETTKQETASEIVLYSVTNTNDSKIENIDFFTGETDFIYVPETDSQTDLGDYADIALAQDGFFRRIMIEDSYTLLVYYDYDKGQENPLCRKEGCRHEDASCGAILEYQEYELPYLWYQGDSIYVPKLDGEELRIEKISSTNGAIRENSCNLMKMDKEMVTMEDGTVHTRICYPEIQVHRGYAYFATGLNGSAQICGLYRVKLDSEENAEALYTLEASGNQNSTIYRIKAYGRYVLFEMGYVEHGINSSNYSVSLYAYDTQSGKVSCVCEDVLCDYTVGQNALYYLDTEGNIYKRDFQTGEIMLFYETEESKEYDYEKLFCFSDMLVYEQYGQWDDYGTEERQLVIGIDGGVTEIYNHNNDKWIVPYR